jgi:hypothetical protein
MKAGNLKAWDMAKEHFFIGKVVNTKVIGYLIKWKEQENFIIQMVIWHIKVNGIKIILKVMENL